jgi:hypothetical protein
VRSHSQRHTSSVVTPLQLIGGDALAARALTAQKKRSLSLPPSDGNSAQTF